MSEVTDSPVGWVHAHVRRYVESGGSRGHRWSGTDTLLLTTRGRRTGLLRRTALIYGRDGDRFVVVGSNGGKARHPEWYLNLQHDPEVRVQVGAEVFDARAEPATGATRERLWAVSRRAAFRGTRAGIHPHARDRRDCSQTEIK